MKKKPIILLSTCFLVIVISGLAFVMLKGPSIAKPITFVEAQQQARSQKDLPGCFELHPQDIPAKAREDITKTVGAKVINLPTGVAYSTFFKTYNEQNAAGTIVYDGTANTFNFAVKHDGKTQGWTLTDFTACEAKH